MSAWIDPVSLDLRSGAWAQSLSLGSRAVVGLLLVLSGLEVLVQAVSAALFALAVLGSSHSVLVRRSARRLRPDTARSAHPQTRTCPPSSAAPDQVLRLSELLASRSRIPSSTTQARRCGPHGPRHPVVGHCSAHRTRSVRAASLPWLQACS
jgi:hypothetical protein